MRTGGLGIKSLCYEGVSHLILFSLVALEKSLISADTCTGHFLVIVNSPMVIQLVS
jgi:hypothetical protein